MRAGRALKPPQVGPFTVHNAARVFDRLDVRMHESSRHVDLLEPFGAILTTWDSSAVCTRG
jgi:hypothetical protein